MNRLLLLFTVLLTCTYSVVEGSETTRSRRVGLVRRNRPFRKAQPSEVKIEESPKTVVPPVKADGSFIKVYNWYIRQCAENALVTKSVSAAIITLLGDVLAQKFESFLAGEFQPLDFHRMVAFFFCGLVYVGPYVHFWYDTLFRLGKWLERKYKTTKYGQVLAQILVDQSIGVAIYFPSFFYVFEILESFVHGQAPSMETASKKCFGQIGNLLSMQYKIFPITNTFNLVFVPPELRVLFSNVLSIFWNIYLCTLLAN